MVARIAADEQDVDWTRISRAVIVENGVVSRRKEGCCPTSICVALENARKIAHDPMVSTKISPRRRCSSPRDGTLHTTGKPTHEPALKAHRIEVVEHFGTMIFDLR